MSCGGDWVGAHNAIEALLLADLACRAGRGLCNAHRAAQLRLPACVS